MFTGVRLPNPQSEANKNQLNSKQGTKYSLSNLLKVVKTALLLVGDAKLTASDVKMGVIIFKIMEKKRSSENMPLKKQLIMKCLSVELTRASTRR